MAINNQLNIATVPIPVLTTTVTLSSANILAMFVTPVVLIAAPGANRCIMIHDVFNEYIFNTLEYSDGDLIQIQYGNTGSGASPNVTIFYANPILSNTASAFYATDGSDGGGQSVLPTTGTVNQGVYITNQSTPSVGGNSTLKVTVTYSVITTTA